MGVAHLWTELVKYANVCRSWSGSARSSAAASDGRDENEEIVAELCGKVLAIDTSIWLFQCSQQSDLRDAIFDEHARVMYIVIFRIMNLLRYGVMPVFVLEGDTPEAKMGRLNQRSVARGLSGKAVGNQRGGRQGILVRKVVELLDLMGIPHVDAPGEAEAMCAALTVVGLAHGVVTSDVDALLFGAVRVYRECRVQMDSAKNNLLERVEAGEVATRCFGLRQPGATCVRALQAVACLSGCDYSVAGGKGVGVKTALEAVQQLTVGRQDDSHVLPELLRLLETGPDPRPTLLKHCTGCKTCGHEKHSRQSCPQCGPGPCRPRAEGSPCECEFHRSEPQRKFMRVIARAATTGPSFPSECRATIAAFESETLRATRAAEELLRRLGPGGLCWSQRPAVQGVFELMHPLLGHTSADPSKLVWTYAEVRDKMRPVLVEWDMRQGPEPQASVRGVVEFRPRRIKQVAAKDGGSWAYLLEIDRIPEVNPVEVELDREQLSSSRLIKSRHVRRTLVDRLWPHLVHQWEEEEQAKLQKQKKGRRAKAAATDSAAATGGSPGGVSGPSGLVALETKAISRVTSRTGGGGGASQSATSGGSSEVMHRFLQMGAAGRHCNTTATAFTTSVQQPETTPYDDGGRGGAPSNFGRIDEREGELYEQGDDDVMEIQMTQRNDGVSRALEQTGPGEGEGDGAVISARAGAVGARPGQSQVPTGGARWSGGPGAQAQAPARGALLALWSDDAVAEEYGDEYDAYGRGDCHQGAAAKEALQDDLNDIIPTSLDELLAGKSQSGSPRTDPTDWPPPLLSAPGLNCPAGNGGSRVFVDVSSSQREGSGVPSASTAETTATATEPLYLRPFRPQPTGPGPGPESGAAPGRSGRCAAVDSYTITAITTATAAAAVDKAAVRGSPPRSRGTDSSGGNRRGVVGPAVLDVMDLTDSPPGAFLAATARTGATEATTSRITTTALTVVAAGLGADGESVLFLGLGGSGGRPLPHLQQQRLYASVELQQQQSDAGEALGSAVKPSALSSRQYELEVKEGTDEGEEGGVFGQQDHPDQQRERHGLKDPSEEGCSVEEGAVEEGAAVVVRRARLTRALFPEDTCDCDERLPVVVVQRPRPWISTRTASGPGLQQEPQERSLDDAGVVSSPVKRRNTGAGAPGGGGTGDFGAAAPAARRTAITDHVDLTLEDSANEGDDVVDLTL